MKVKWKCMALYCKPEGCFRFSSLSSRAHLNSASVKLFYRLIKCFVVLAPESISDSRPMTGVRKCLRAWLYKLYGCN